MDTGAFVYDSKQTPVSEVSGYTVPSPGIKGHLAANQESRMLSGHGIHGTVSWGFGLGQTKQDEYLKTAPWALGNCD